MQRVKEFVVEITPRDRLRLRITTDGPLTVEVVANLECEIGGQWSPARRYDCAGDDFHYHPRPWDTEDDPHVSVPVGDLGRGLQLATVDLMQRWQEYRAELERAMGGPGA